VIDAATVRANADRIRNRIVDAGGDAERITVVAVTKGHDVSAVDAALEAGLLDIGENYAQELAAKAETVTVPRWNFIGQLQRNKVRSIAHLVHVWQSVDRLTLGNEIAKRAPGAAVLVEVNLTDDPKRGGAQPSFVPGLVDGLHDLGLDVRGLMAVAPHGGPDEAATGFDLVRRLADNLDLDQRSMGMTLDLEAAVRAGSTMVRIGTALFGARQPR